ncbi:MFS transporter [Candidatus Bathyarchaeota archaeon]|nr:MFS transporter [Candidatus Bathyarchaeota archaeon]
MKSILPKRIPRGARWFLAGRIMSGLGDGITNIAVQLYLVELGFNAGELGLAFMLKLAGTALLTIPTGYLADRHGRDRVLSSGLILFIPGIILFIASRTMEVLILSLLLLGLSDAAFVVLTPLYSSFFKEEDMDRAFSLDGFLSISSLSAGSLFGFIPPVLVGSLGLRVLDSYWGLLIIAASLYIIRFPLFIYSIRSLGKLQRGGGSRLSVRSKDVVARFVLLTAILNLGYGVFFNLLPYYAYRRFGAGSDILGLLFSVSYIVSAVANFIAGRVSERFGSLSIIAACFGLCAPVYLSISQAPSILWASILILLRLGLANIASPLITSLFMKLLREGEKATANGILMTASIGSTALATLLGGFLMERDLNLPIYLGSGLYALYASTFYLLLKGRVKETSL